MTAADLVGRRDAGQRGPHDRDAHDKWIRKVASPVADGKLVVASVADDMVCRLWDAETGKLLHELARPRGE